MHLVEKKAEKLSYMTNYTPAQSYGVNWLQLLQDILVALLGCEWPFSDTLQAARKNNFRTRLFVVRAIEKQKPGMSFFECLRATKDITPHVCELAQDTSEEEFVTLITESADG